MPSDLLSQLYVSDLQGDPVNYNSQTMRLYLSTLACLMSVDSHRLCGTFMRLLPTRELT